MLAPGDDAVYVFAFAPQNLETLEGLPLAGGAATTLAGSEQYPADLVADGVNLYWTLSVPSAGGSLVTLPFSGGMPTTLVSSSDVGGALVLMGLVEASGVYFITDLNSVFTLRRTAVGGPSGGDARSAYNLLRLHRRLWPNGGSGGDICFVFNVPEMQDTIQCVSKQGPSTQAARLLATANASVVALVADDLAVYWVEGNTDQNTIYRVVK